MPKLIARLVRRLESHNASSRPSVRAPKRNTRPKSLFLERPAAPDWFRPRSRSILEDDVNPFTCRHAFTAHKRLPPRPTHAKHVLSASPSGAVDQPREMTDQERERWANPYLRMLSAPLRKCIITGANLPTDFLVRVTPQLLPSKQPQSTKGRQAVVTLLGDGLEHPKFRSLRDRRGSYVLCRADVFERFEKQSTWRKYIHHNLALHAPSVVEQIGHLLRLRVLQEVELLSARVQARPQRATDVPLVRRLTQAELSAMRATGIPPDKDVVAVIVIPPLNKNPETKTRPTPNSTSLPDSQTPPSTDTQKTTFPSSELVRPAPTTEDDNPMPETWPHQVPLYNSVALFPSCGQRAALYDGLSKLLMIERRARFREGAQSHRDSKDGKTSRAKGDGKPSHAFVIYSGGSSQLRADTVPLAIALWRLRMWEGSSWQAGAGTWLDIS